MKNDNLPQKSSRRDIDAFLGKVANSAITHSLSGNGRLLFALDATASREPTWDHACHLQSQMFTASESLGGLSIQLCYYHSLDSFHASAWHRSPQALLKEMNAVRCLAGHTQIERVLRHALALPTLNALVFIGDAMEEDASRLRQLAGELGLQGKPVFIFHEGHDALAHAAFTDIARLSHGACCPFDINSPDQLRELLAAVAVYASGGYQALVKHCNKNQGQQLGKQLIKQLIGPQQSQPTRPKT